MIGYLNPLNWMRWFGQFVFFWLVSIPWKSVSAAIPAVALTVGLAALTYFATSDGGSWRRNLIKGQLKEAIQTENFETADLLLRRQIVDGDQSSETMFLFAENLFRMGSEDEANTLMRELATRQRSDQAALWLIQKLYLKKTWADLDAEAQTEYGRLLALVSEQQPKNGGIRQIYSDYLIASNRFSEAIPLLIESTKTEPMRGLQAAMLARQIGDTAMADRLANATLESVSRTFQEEPSNPLLVRSVVLNQVFLDRHSDAVQTLADSIARMKTDEHRTFLNQMMGETLVAWINNIEKEPNDTPEERLQVLRMLQFALQHAPNNPRVLTLLSDQVLRTLESSDEEVKTIRNALVRGSSPGISHFIRGTASLMKGDEESAERHLTIAAKHLPNSPAILNNLAVALSQSEDAELEKALLLSEQAITSMENPGPYFYDTRGQILLKLERYLDAIPDLERALGVDTLAADAHRSLAKCYQQLGDEELASDHQAAADAMGESTKTEK